MTEACLGVQKYLLKVSCFFNCFSVFIKIKNIKFISKTNPNNSRRKEARALKFWLRLVWDFRNICWKFRIFSIVYSVFIKVRKITWKYRKIYRSSRPKINKSTTKQPTTLKCALWVFHILKFVYPNFGTFSMVSPYFIKWHPFIKPFKFKEYFFHYLFFKFLVLLCFSTFFQSTFD